MEPERGETIFFRGHPCWRSIVPFYAKGVLASVVAGTLAGALTATAAGKVKLGWVILGVLAGFAGTLILGMLRRVQTTYTITDRRLAIEQGFFARERHETRLERVQEVRTQQSVMDRLLLVGAVAFETAAEPGYDFCFRGVAEPRRIARTVHRALPDTPGGRLG